MWNLHTMGIPIYYHCQINSVIWIRWILMGFHSVFSPLVMWCHNGIACYHIHSNIATSLPTSSRYVTTMDEVVKFMYLSQKSNWNSFCNSHFKFVYKKYICAIKQDHLGGCVGLVIIVVHQVTVSCVGFHCQNITHGDGGGSRDMPYLSDITYFIHSFTNL